MSVASSALSELVEDFLPPRVAEALRKANVTKLRDLIDYDELEEVANAAGVEFTDEFVDACCDGVEAAFWKKANRRQTPKVASPRVVRRRIRPALPTVIKEACNDITKTVRAKRIVDVLLESVKSSNEMSFDYVTLVLSASLLALLGLVWNSVVVVVASMLVSPLMGPLTAVCWGIVTNERDMISKGLFNESMSLCFCVVVGFVGGLCAAPFADELNWPTMEMKSRSEASALLVGVFVALVSGVGLALSVSGQNTSSLVGVAISASLVPPAVNGGLLWAYALVDSNAPKNAAVQGLVSLCLALLNILLIAAVAVLVFKLKEIAPSSGDVFERGLRAKRESMRVNETPANADSPTSRMFDGNGNLQRREEPRLDMCPLTPAQEHTLRNFVS